MKRIALTFIALLTIVTIIATTSKTVSAEDAYLPAIFQPPASTTPTPEPTPAPVIRLKDGGYHYNEPGHFMMYVHVYYSIVMEAGFYYIFPDNDNCGSAGGYYDEAVFITGNSFHMQRSSPSSSEITDEMSCLILSDSSLSCTAKDYEVHDKSYNIDASCHVVVTARPTWSLHPSAEMQNIK